MHWEGIPGKNKTSEVLCVCLSNKGKTRVVGAQRAKEKVKMRLDRKVGSLISRGEVFWGKLFTDQGVQPVFSPQMALSPMAFAGWKTASELAEVGDFV